MEPSEAPSITLGASLSEVLAALWGRNHLEAIQALFLQRLIPSSLLKCSSSACSLKVLTGKFIYTSALFQALPRSSRDRK